ncbi:hypothetical protein EDC04DRAFT_3092449 [Pisolithus marmoratus]|nr:hypothetical protein EDC04DRAFT_3092449 [Pisolithus marmoratus]
MPKNPEETQENIYRTSEDRETKVLEVLARAYVSHNTSKHEVKDKEKERKQAIRWWVPELAQEERKTGYANFKRAVWHEAFFKLLEKVTELSKVGYLYECYDKVLRWLFPIILILSADYEELYALLCDDPHTRHEMQVSLPVLSGPVEEN